MNPQHNGRSATRVDWQEIDTVLLDMDGTLLDKYFDDYFWEHYVPELFARKNALSLDEAKKTLLGKYKKEEGTLAWTDLDHWSRELDLDIPALKRQVDHLIQVHPYVIDFLEFCRRNRKMLYLVTNAHGKSLDIKMQKTAVGKYFDRIICSSEIGSAKEEPDFWRKLKKVLRFDPTRTLLADDTEDVLLTARSQGIGILIYVARPSSKTPVRFSTAFPSIVYFKELL